MNCDKKPSEERRWMQYYPEMMLRMIQKPDCTVWEYLERHCPGMDGCNPLLWRGYHLENGF
ncbi:MAG: hypothetical protein ACLUD0_17775 [Eubacterium ramulus]